MKFLDDNDYRLWCETRGFRTREYEGLRGAVPDLSSPDFHFLNFSLPVDSGRKVAFSKQLYSLLPTAYEHIILLGSWGVWPSSEHIPLLTRLREALGDTSSLIERPAHLVGPADRDDAVSLIIIAMQFIWDCYLLSGNGALAIAISHDEAGWIASRDQQFLEDFAKKSEDSISFL